MMIKKRFDITCRCSLLVIFLLFMGSTLFFNHTHISDGNIIVHSHPFKADQDGKPIHSHVDYSYILIHMLNNFITNTTLLILIAAPFLFLTGELLRKSKEIHLSEKWVLQYHLRGPPSIML
ncbi:MAG: hypothetical protein A2X04_10325 [Bacteroidetes bacterium GWF2_41_9]|nr:MAG: hypothetical protein A2X03_03920 [Bacteroidetes bacterium GWA2_40_15]OFY59861.1 MAG: hypothetical protein A2X04_10325 [Bacteroidetes bacterium GWF2_41_9]HAM08722.1 hypothetical protein [Bacteroidales bacterium]HBQ81635.1 hypothetical protein [Bacteroidales bacterium]